MKTEQCLFKNKTGSLISADDGIVIGSNKEEMERVIRKSGKEFEIKKENEPSSFLGLQIIRDNDSIKL